MLTLSSSSALKTVYLLLLGQLASFSIALCSITASLLSSLGVDAPLTQTSFGYFSVAVVYGSIFLSRRQKLQVPFYWYLLLGFVDVQGNYLVIKAYQYSSITSVTLLDCFATVWIVILTWAFLKTRYSLWQLLGAAICVGGLGLVLVSDAGVGGGGGSKPLIGDTLVIAGTVFYALSNVGEEFCVKKRDRVEVVAMLGCCGFFFNLLEILLFERKSLESIKLSKDVILSILGYTCSTFALYSLVPFVLKRSGAAMFSLSVLTSDMWAVVFRIFFYHQKVDWLYFVAFAVVVVGLVIYLTTGKHEESQSSIQDEMHYQIIDDEDDSVSKWGQIAAI